MAGISVIIPAFNEAPRIGATVEALLKLDEVGEVLVVDDGSTDGTAGAAARSGARVIRMEQNRGKSAAVLHGLRQVEAPVVALVDADLGATAGELKKLFPPVLQGGAAMAVARFPAGRRRGGFGMVKRLASWAIRICTG
ncbi:MAG: glycosyltransferase family 2 protein, partial [Dethiobacteria bacterium]